MAQRTELHKEIVHILEQCGVPGAASRAHFQPPENIQLVYPCVIYALDGDWTIHANDALYGRKKRYTLTAITKDPDSNLQDAFLKLKYCRFSRHFTSDNLHHFVFTLYY